MAERDDFNTKVIEEFRANAGKVGGGFAGAPMILLHHRGAKSGTERVNPLVYQRVGDAFALFASKAGAPTHPDWYRNLMANPDTKVEVGEETYQVHARELHGPERDEIWEKQKSLMPGFAEYEEKARGKREIPVILLERR
ncbi:MAG: nitroreductase family deazaflavin-dependent oxidoreductase [Acidimicrobiaceae bacterium]|nr:nitroreductase family deazaflavin-dependent oxidoreductase [Acidimicrobiaceae bacterium]